MRKLGGKMRKLGGYEDQGQAEEQGFPWESSLFNLCLAGPLGDKSPDFCRLGAFCTSYQSGPWKTDHSNLIFNSQYRTEATEVTVLPLSPR